MKISMPSDWLNAFSLSILSFPELCIFPNRLSTRSFTVKVVDRSASITPSTNSVSGLRNSCPNRVKSTLPFIPARTAGFLNRLVTLACISNEVLSPFIVSCSSETKEESGKGPFRWISRSISSVSIPCLMSFI